MFDVEKGSKELLEGLDSNERTYEVDKWTKIYNILKVLGIIGSGVALVQFGVTPLFGVVVGSFLAGIDSVYQFKLQPAKAKLAKENEEKIALALELSSKNGVPVDIKSFDTKLVAVDDATKDATFIATKTGETVTYGKVGKKTFYFKYADSNGENHLLAGVENRKEVSELVDNVDGYSTRIAANYSVSGLEAKDEDALSEYVVNQIIDYENKQAELVANKKKIKSR